MSTNLNSPPVITEEAMARYLKGSISYTLDNTVATFPNSRAAKLFINFLKDKGCYYTLNKTNHSVKFFRRNIQGGSAAK